MPRANPMIALSGQPPDMLTHYLSLQESRRANRLAALREQEFQQAQAELAREEERQARVRNALAQLGTPDLPQQQRQATILRLYGDDPRLAAGVSAEFRQAQELQRQQQIEEARQHYLEADYVIRNPQFAVDFFRRRRPDEYAQVAQQLGREPTTEDVIRLAHLARAQYGAIAGIGHQPSPASNLPASVQEWMYYSSLSPEQQQRYLQMKRATDRIVDIGGVPTLVQTGVTPTTQPLSTIEDESKAAGEKRRAQAEATAEVEEEKTRRQNELAYNAFQSAMQALEQAMEETVTGPIAGRVPAFTAAQQTAEGAVAAMAPILKQLFRSAGEGTFTDRDQDLLLDMVPKRTDHPEARRAKIATIKQIVADKLGITTAGSQPAAQPTASRAAPASSLPAVNARGWRLMVDAHGNRAYVSPDGTQYEEVP